MTKEEALNAVAKVFQNVPRPTYFGRSTCDCQECKEHEHTLSSFTSERISYEQLGNPCWDPICYANNQAFLYYLPAMIRLAFDEEDYYTDQLISHLEDEERTNALNSEQTVAIRNALQTLIEVDLERIQNNLDAADLKKIIRKLEQSET